MRTYTLVAAALAVALTTGCKDRDRDDTGQPRGCHGRQRGRCGTRGRPRRRGRCGHRGTRWATRSATWATPPRTRRARPPAPGPGTAVRSTVRRRGSGSPGWTGPAQARKNVNHDASEAFTKGVAAARETRRDVGAHLDRLGQATESNWTEVRDEFRASIDDSPVSSRRSSLTRSRWEAPGRRKLLPRGTRR